MEATQTIKTSDAWRLAISLTCEEAQRIISIIKDYCRYIGIILYITTALGFMMMENDETIAFNVIGILMMLFAGLKAQAKR